MANKQTILTIDIGNTTLKMAEFSFDAESNSMFLDKFAFENINSQANDKVQAFAALYKEMLITNNFSSKDVRLSISSQVSFCRLSKLPELKGDSATIAKILEFEAKQTVPYAINEIVWDYQIIKHNVLAAGEDIPHDEFEALFVAVKKDLITEYTDIILESGKNVISVNISPVVMFNAAIASRQEQTNECEAILNIGGHCSSLVIFQNERVFMRSIPIAGDAITQQISKEFGISMSEAEDLKRKHGFVALGGAYEDPDSEVAATISKIARNVMTRLHGEISRSINVWRSQHNGDRPVKIQIAGGGSLIPYIPEFFNEKLKVPVEFLNIFSVCNLGPEIDKENLLDVAPMFSELVGMGLESATMMPVEINILPETIKFQVDIQSKKIYFYALCVTVILSLLVFYVGTDRLIAFEKGRVAKVDEKVIATKDLLERINNERRQMQNAKDDYMKFFNVIQSRESWKKVMLELQKITPDTMWFVEISGLEKMPDPNASQAVAQNPNNGGFMGGGGPPEPGMGDPGMGDPGMGDPSMGGYEVNNNVQKAAKEYSYVGLKLTGYSLLLEQEILGDTFRENLKNSTLFKTDKDGVTFELLMQESDKNNIVAFVIYLQFKEPMKL